MQVVLTEDLSQPLSKAAAVWSSLGQEGVRSSELSLVGQRLVPKSCQGYIRHWCRRSEGLKGVKNPSPVARRPEAGWGLATNVI